jgi:hypothetical protein
MVAPLKDTDPSGQVLKRALNPRSACKARLEFADFTSEPEVLGLDFVNSGFETKAAHGFRFID